MNCPVCNVPLSLSDRSGVEIDYCPKCRGIWLDRGELDKLIERASAGAPEQPTAAQPAAWNRQPPPPPVPHQQGGYHPELDDSKHGYRYKRKKNWLGEILDFD